MTEAKEPPPRPSWKKRVFQWTLALVALGFVAYVVPIRDRCEDPSAPATRVTITREADACTLHIRSGDVRIPRAQCDQLKCEPGLATTFAQARIGALLAMLLLYALGNVAWAARWRMLLTLAGVRMSLWQVLRVSIEAQAGGILLPGGIGGDALRIASVMGAPHAKSGGKVSGSIVVASVLLDRVIGLVTMGAFAAALGLTLGGKEVSAPALVLASFPFAFVLGLVVLRSKRLSGLRLLNEGRIGRITKPVLEYIGDPHAPKAIAWGLAISLVVSATQLGVIRGLVFALGGVPAAERWVYVGSAMAFIVSAVPALPGGWGTGDAAFVYFLGLAGLSPAVALAVSLLFRLFWYLTGATGAILYLTRGKRG